MTANRQNENILKRNEATQKFAPFTPSATSYGMEWKTLQAVRYRKSPASGEFSLLPVSRHGLVLTIRPAERLHVRYDGVRLDRPPVAGSIDVIPAGSSVLWRRQGSMDALFIHLEPSVVARVAAESFDFESSRTVLPPLYGLNVPELRSAMLAVDAELRAGGAAGSLLAEVVFRSGFANQSHSCFHFKRIAGVTPRQFRGSERICDSEQMMRTLTGISVDEDISR